jgi:hypothetical protein
MIADSTSSRLKGFATLSNIMSPLKLDGSSTCYNAAHSRVASQ